MDGGDLLLTYLAIGAFMLFCFFYACCVNLKEDCGGKRTSSSDAYSPCFSNEKDVVEIGSAKDDNINEDLVGSDDGGWDASASASCDGGGGSCDV